MFTHVGRTIAATVLTASLSFVVACGGSPSSTGGHGTANDSVGPSTADYEKAFENNFDSSNTELKQSLSSLFPESSDVTTAENSYKMKDDSVIEFSVAGNLPFFVVQGTADENEEMALFDQNGTLVASGMVNGESGALEWDATLQAQSHL